jgi:hypothetical protein
VRTVRRVRGVFKQRINDSNPRLAFAGPQDERNRWRRRALRGRLLRSRRDLLRPRRLQPSEVVEFYGTREEAERTLRDVLRDELDWRDIPELLRVESGWDEARGKRVMAPLSLDVVDAIQIKIKSIASGTIRSQSHM